MNISFERLRAIMDLTNKPVQAWDSPEISSWLDFTGLPQHKTRFQGIFSINDLGTHCISQPITLMETWYSSLITLYCVRWAWHPWAIELGYWLLCVTFKIRPDIESIFFIRQILHHYRLQAKRFMLKWLKCRIFWMCRQCHLPRPSSRQWCTTQAVL